jgi:hypothetical protein
MYCLSDLQIDFILDDLRSRGIMTESLQNDLLDHICIMIERRLEVDGEFQQVYASIIPAFYRHELREIEVETRMLLKYRRHWAISRNLFFILLFTVLIGPIIGYASICTWMVHLGMEHGGSYGADVWTGILVFALYPLLVLLIIILTPDRFEPLIPRKSIVLLGFSPLIKIVPAC